jgi:hypothetical protein
MTAQAERIKAAHRGHSRAEPASRSRIAALDTFGLRYERVDDFNVIVEGRFLLNLAMSYWRSVDDEDGCHGYLVSTLDAEIKKRTIERLAADVPPGTTLLMIDTFNSSSGKPVTGRDSAAANRIASTDPSAAVAEFVTGDISHETGSASLLPAVTP